LKKKVFTEKGGKTILNMNYRKATVFVYFTKS